MSSSLYLTPLSALVHPVWPQAFVYCINKRKQRQLYLLWHLRNVPPLVIICCIIFNTLFSSYLYPVSCSCADPNFPHGDHETVMCCNLMCLRFLAPYLFVDSVKLLLQHESESLSVWLAAGRKQGRANVIIQVWLWLDVAAEEVADAPTQRWVVLFEHGAHLETTSTQALKCVFDSPRARYNMQQFSF